MEDIQFINENDAGSFLPGGGKKLAVLYGAGCIKGSQFHCGRSCV